MTLDEFIASIILFQEMYDLGSEPCGLWPDEFTFAEWLEEIKKWLESDMLEVINEVTNDL